MAQPFLIIELYKRFPMEIVCNLN